MLHLFYAAALTCITYTYLATCIVFIPLLPPKRVVVARRSHKPDEIFYLFLVISNRTATQPQVLQPPNTLNYIDWNGDCGSVQRLTLVGTGLLAVKNFRRWKNQFHHSTTHRPRTEQSVGIWKFPNIGLARYPARSR